MILSEAPVPAMTVFLRFRSDYGFRVEYESTEMRKRGRLMPELDSSIVAVTVYMNRARITRRGTVTLPPGDHDLTLVNLPMSLEDDSVRASGRSSAGVKILGV